MRIHKHKTDRVCILVIKLYGLLYNHLIIYVLPATYEMLAQHAHAVKEKIMEKKQTNFKVVIRFRIYSGT